MKEKLSALIDGEIEGDGLHDHLGRLRTDAELQRAWDIYHLIGDALRGQISPAIADRVVARLREEPTVLAPRPRPSRQLGWYAMAAAASVAAVGFVVWTASPGWRVESQLAGGPAAATVAAPASAPVTLVSSAPPAEVENYLLAHQPYSHTSAMQGIAPYARSVADERRAAGK